MSASKTLTNVVVYSLAIFYGIIAAVRLTIGWIKHSLNFFRVKHRPLPPACLMDESLGRHSFLKLKEVTLHYVENGNRSKPLMLCLHGFPEFWYSWRHQLREFADDYWVVAIDMRGYGDSDKPVGKSNYHLNHLTSDVKEFIEALGREKADVLMAHDWGGAVAYTFTGKYPEMVGKLVVMNCPHLSAFVKVLRSSLQQLKMSWYIFLYQLPYLPELMFKMADMNIFKLMFAQPQNPKESILSDEDLEAFKYTFSKPGAMTPPINYYRNLDFEELSKIAPRITVPTLLLWGTGDIALSEATAEATGECVVDFQLKKFDGVTHWINQDAPVQVNKAVREFLQPHTE